jgi:hypothetical protein
LYSYFFRHEKYFNFWRATEAINCAIGDEKNFDSHSSFYYKVFCESCGIQVGAHDEDGFYHFFGVLPNPPNKTK